MSLIPVKRITREQLEVGRDWPRVTASYKKGLVHDQSKGMTVDYGYCSGCVAANVWEIKTGEMESGKSIYELSKKYDYELTGEKPDKSGTSLRKAFSALARKHKVEDTAYLVDLKNINEMMSWLVGYGPVAFGSYWVQGMKYPKGFWKKWMEYEGYKTGGHAATIIGVHKSGYVRIENSWGRDWGNKGIAYMRFNELERLIVNSESFKAFGFATN